MLPILQLGPLALQLPGLLILLGVWVGTHLIEKEAPRHKLPAGVLSNMVFFSLLGGIAGARLGYALRFFEVYSKDPLGLIALNPHTLAPFEGVVAALIVALIYGQRKHLPLYPTLDAFTQGLASMAIFLGLANISSGDAFGAPTTVPWAIDLWGASRHPSQIYETIAAALVYLVIQRLKIRSPFPGFNFTLWILLTSISRLFLEAFRGDSVLIFDGLRSAQVVSLALAVAAMLAFHYLARRHARADAE
ncbi:MAG: prolipoprotein diacylglyceryl transferase [Anaerolineaceae bacterium]|nr:MAG: prolipoprotein diacylglyceryl transferase [Anaerolineaceae bacterium]